METVSMKIKEMDMNMEGYRRIKEISCAGKFRIEQVWMIKRHP